MLEKIRQSRPYKKLALYDFLSLCSPWLEKIKIPVLALLFMAAPAHAQDGCCQVSASSCSAPVTKTYCEQQLKGVFQENVACRTDTGTCGILAGTDVPMPLWLSLAMTFGSLLIFVVVIVFVARRMRKSTPNKG